MSHVLKFLSNGQDLIYEILCSATSNSDHFWGPSLVTVLLEVTAAGRFFHIFFSSKNTSLKRRLKQFIHLFYLHVLQSFDQRYCNQLLSEIRNVGNPYSVQLCGSICLRFSHLTRLTSTVIFYRKMNGCHEKREID